ncbi:hypothetical protein QJQ45_029961, partial [Haematococcus lacustris]
MRVATGEMNWWPEAFPCRAAFAAIGLGNSRIHLRCWQCGALQQPGGYPQVDPHLPSPLSSARREHLDTEKKKKKKKKKKTTPLPVSAKLMYPPRVPLLIALVMRRPAPLCLSCTIGRVSLQPERRCSSVDHHQPEQPVSLPGAPQPQFDNESELARVAQFQEHFRPPAQPTGTPLRLFNRFAVLDLESGVPKEQEALEVQVLPSARSQKRRRLLLATPPAHPTLPPHPPHPTLSRKRQRTQPPSTATPDLTPTTVATTSPATTSHSVVLRHMGSVAHVLKRLSWSDRAAVISLLQEHGIIEQPADSHILGAMVLARMKTLNKTSTCGKAGEQRLADMQAKANLARLVPPEVKEQRRVTAFAKASGISQAQFDGVRQAWHDYTKPSPSVKDLCQFSERMVAGCVAQLGMHGPSPAQPSPAQPSPAQPSPAQPSPAQPSPAQPSPAQPSPAQPSPAQPSPAQPSPAQPSPAQPSPAQPSPAQPSPAQPSPAQPSPAQPSPAQPSPAQPSPAQPSPAQPSPAQPSPAQPSPAQPSPAQPSPAQPSPAQPSPAQPSPAQPSPAQPSPAQPSPAQPSPAQPSPAQPSPAQPSPPLPSPPLPPPPPPPSSPYHKKQVHGAQEQPGATAMEALP